MAEDHPAAASTAAPPTGRDGICVSHAAATSGGSSGGEICSTDDVYDGEEECEPCPKASRGGSNNMNNKNNNNNVGGGGGIDGALRAERGSPYARPRKEAKSPAVGEDAIVQNRRVYVGNLSWQVTWRELKDHMKSGGDVVRADVLTGYDGRSRGCGIVEYGTVEEANDAVANLNDTELMGRKIFVREDREESRPMVVAVGVVAPASSGGGGGGGGGRGGGGGGGGGDAAAAGRSVYVGNLAYETAWQDLKDHMRSAGDVLRAEVLTMHDGRSKGCGVVEYASVDAASRAITELNDSELMGRQIFVREDRERGGSNNNNGGGGGGGGAREGDGGYLAGWHRGGGGGPRGNAGNLSVYVGNLAYETTWQELKDHMRAAGNVDKADILKSADGRSKGCGIVLYQKSHEVARAIRELENSELHGRPILVREDREQGGGGGGYHQQGGGGFGNNRGGRQGGGYQQQQQHRGAGFVPGGPAPEGCQLFVGNLSWETGWQELKDHFRQCGHVDRAEVAEGPDGVKRGFGLVRYRNAMDAANAIDTLNGVELMGRPLEVRIDNKA